MTLTWWTWTWSAVVIAVMVLYLCKQPCGGVAIAVLMRKPIDLPLWLKHHRAMGITRFFIRLEDSPGYSDFLMGQPDVTLEIGDSDKQNNYTTLQVRQVQFVNQSIAWARRMGIRWIFHIDADELLHGDLQFLSNVDDRIKCLRLENAEAMFDDSQDTCFGATEFMRCGLHAPCRSYANGKGGGRVCDGLSLAGPHHFGYKGQFTGDCVMNVPFDTLRVLHFDSCSFGAWVEKFLHLGKRESDEKIPFPWYHESIQAAREAFNVYKQKTHKDAIGVSDDLVWSRDH